MRQLTGAEFQSFVAAKQAAAICFDAAWDATAHPLIRQRMLKAENEFRDIANFGRVDVQRDMELAEAMHLLNVPTVGYYRDGQVVALLIGGRQNVCRRLERVMRGEVIGYSDGFDESPD